MSEVPLESPTHIVNHRRAKSICMLGKSIRMAGKAQFFPKDMEVVYKLTVHGARWRERLTLQEYLSHKKKPPPRTLH